MAEIVPHNMQEFSQLSEIKIDIMMIMMLMMMMMMMKKLTVE